MAARERKREGLLSEETVPKKKKKEKEKRKEEEKKEKGKEGKTKVCLKRGCSIPLDGDASREREQRPLSSDPRL